MLRSAALYCYCEPFLAVFNTLSELMDFKQNQEYTCKNGIHLPVSLSAALEELEETATLIFNEVEEVKAELLHQQFVLTDHVTTHLLLQNLLYQLLDCTRQAMDVETVTVLLQTEDKQQLAVKATLGLEEEITEEIRIPIGRGFAGRIAASGELVIVDDLSTVEVVSPILRNKGLQSMLGVPLLVKNQVIGVFHVGKVRPHKFTTDDAQLLRLIAEHVGSAIECLKIWQSSEARSSAEVREKFALTCSLQKLSRSIRSFDFHPLAMGFVGRSDVAASFHPTLKYNLAT